MDDSSVECWFAQSLDHSHTGRKKSKQGSRSPETSLISVHFACRTGKLLKDTPDLSPSGCDKGLLVLVMHGVDVLPQAPVPVHLPVDVAIGHVRDHEAEREVHLLQGESKTRQGLGV